MAGSFGHIVNDKGMFTFEYIGNMADAYECAEECFWLIHYLAGGDSEKIKNALNQMYKNRCDTTKLEPIEVKDE